MVARIDIPQHGEREEALANARLIAAAPDLLAACQAILAHETHPMFTMMRAAVAKATGKEVA